MGEEKQEQKNRSVWSRIGWKWPLGAVLLVLLIKAIVDYQNVDVIFEPISVSLGLDRAGIGSILLTNLIAARSTELATFTSTSFSVKGKSITLSSAENIPEIDIPETKLSLKALVTLLRQGMWWHKPARISGDAGLSGQQVQLTIRVSDSGESALPVDTALCTADPAKLNDAVDCAALFVFERFDPVNGALRRYNYDPDPARAYEMISQEAHLNGRSKGAALLVWAGMLGEQHRFPIALKKLEESRQILGNSEAYALALGALYESQGRVREAADAYRGVASWSKGPPNSTALGQLRLRQGDLDRGMADCQSALDADRHYWLASVCLADGYSSFGDDETATTFHGIAVEAAKSKLDSASALEAWGRWLTDRHRYDAAASKLHEAIRINNQQLGAFLQFGRLRQLMGRKVAADLFYETAHTMHTYPAEVLKVRTNDLTDIGDWDAAIAAGLKTVHDSPDYDFGHGALAIAYYLAGMKAEADAEFGESVRVSLYPAQPYLDWGNVLRQIGEPEEALKKYRAAAREDPLSTDAHLSIANTLCELERGDEAAAEYKTSMSHAISPGVVYKQWADCEVRSGHFDLAMIRYEMGASFSPDRADSFLALGTLAVETGQTWASKEWFQKAIAASRFPPGTMIAEAVELFSRDRASSEALIKTALQLKRGWSEALAALADDEASRREFESSGAHFAEAVANSENPADILVRWASVSLRADSVSEARKHLEAALQLDRSNANAQAAMCLLLMKEGKPVDEKTLSNALSGPSDDVFVYSEIGEQLLRQPRPLLAAQAYRRAVLLAPRWAYKRERYALALRRANNPLWIRVADHAADLYEIYFKAGDDGDAETAIRISQQLLEEEVSRTNPAIARKSRMRIARLQAALKAKTK